MAYKNLGIGVSQLPQGMPGDQFSGEEKSFESVVIQTTKPVIDWEMNLRSEITSDHGVRLSNSRQLPSCWINPGFLDSPDISNAYSFPVPLPGAENIFLISPQNLIVNGWNLKFQCSDSTSTNIINLPMPPVGIGSYRVDLVILEVWRALVLAVPSVANKSAGGLIFRHGNVKSPDTTPNFADDLIDPTEAAETSARVQIQYRYRVIGGIDPNTYPDGLDDPSVTANTVSDFTGPGADGTPTAYTYSPVTNDAGLWAAGTGTAVDAAALGTVDGYMYAIPICAVFRRNNTAYDRTTNINGGALIVAGASDRPDGLFSDQIIISDIKDLRKGSARDYGETIQKAVQQIFNNSLSTEHEILIPAGPGGTSLSVQDSIINTDGVRQYFSDRSITETIVCHFHFPWPPGVWPILSVQVDLSAFKLWFAPFNLLSVAPAGTNIVSVNKVRLVDQSVLLNEIDMLASPIPGTGVSDIQYSASVPGGPIDIATINLIPPGYSYNGTTDIYVEVAIEYPAGNGLSRNVIDDHAVWTPSAADIDALYGAVLLVDATLFTATSDANRFSLDSTLWAIDKPHREAFIRLKTIEMIANPCICTDGIHIYIPDKITDPILITDGINPPYPTTNYTFNTAYTEVTLTFPLPVPPGPPYPWVQANYYAYRPLPMVGPPPDDSYQVFYQSRAIQSLLPASGGMAPETLHLIPRTNPDNIYVITSGSGSPDDSFPFESPSAQIPVGLLPSSTYPESRLDNPNPVSIIGFGINTGFIKLDAKVPYFPDAIVTLYKSAPDIVTDGDGRHFWPKSDDGVTPVYSPVVFGHLLTAKQRHKVASPVLMELAEDVPSIGRKGTLVLVILTNWLEFDDQNTIQLNSILSSSSAAVYRVRGHLINPQRTVF